MAAACNGPRPDNIMNCRIEDDMKKAWRSMASEYTTQYLKWPPQEKEPIRPPSNEGLIYDASAKHNMKTMYDETFVDHPPTARTKCIRPPQNHQDNLQGYNDCLSTYKDNYRNTKGLGQRRKAFRPCPADNQFGMQNASVEKSSVSQRTYRAYGPDEFQTARRKPIIIKPEHGGVFPVGDDVVKFKTTVQDNFKSPGQLPRRRPIVPESAHGGRDCRNMELLTTNRADFGYKLPEPCLPAPALLRERGNRTNAQMLPFNFRSTFQDDYINHAYVRRPKSFKPLQQYVVSEIPFQTQTLYTEDFKQLPNQGPPNAYKLKGNLQLSKTCQFQGSTQYMDEFNPPPSNYKRRDFIKSKTNRSAKGKFYDETSYNMNFFQFDLSQMKPRSNFKPVCKYQPPTIPFQVKSTAHAHYQGVPAPPSKICKPVTRPRIDTCVC